MKIVYTKILFFLIEYAYLNLISGVASSNLTHYCIFGVKSVSMVLYNGNNPFGKKNIGVQEVCDIDTSKRVLFLIHGFNTYVNHTDFYNLTQQFLKKQYTVFSVDWDDASCKNGIDLLNLPEYPSAVDNTREVGDHVADYCIELIDQCQVPLKNILFIGHSLGAHVSGFAAKKIQKKLNVTVPRIIGADPAGPLFVLRDCAQRLCKSDADTVCAFHTSYLGIPYSIGHYDFYFNSAIIQPGCTTIPCSHNRSIVYQTYMMQYNCGYSAVPKTLFSKCSETNNDIVLNSRIYEENYIKEGEYSVCTSSEPPYCTKDI